MADRSVSFELWYDGQWNPAPVYTRDRLKFMRGVKAPGSDSDPATAPLTLNNHSGNYAPRSLVSPLRGKIGQNTKGRIVVDGGVRMVGEVASWKPGRAIKGDAWTEIELAGVLRRIGRGTDPLLSALTRAVMADGPAAYWPINDGRDSTQAGNAVSGGAPMVVDGKGLDLTVAFAQVDGPVAGDKYPQFINSGAYTGELVGQVPFVAGSPRWQFEGWFNSLTTQTAAINGLPFSFGVTGSTVVDWVEVELEGEGRVNVHFHNATGVKILTLPTSLGLAVTDGAWHYVRIVVSQDAPTTWGARLWYDGQLRFTASSLSGTIGWPSWVQATGRTDDTFTVPDTMSVKDLAVGAVDSDHYAAGLGYAGETAADRFSRLCTEGSITPTVIGNAAESLPMGPQRAVALLVLLDEIARTDDASIFETRDDVGLTMRTGASKLNQTPAFTISYLGQVKPPLTPVVGDAGIRNDVTANNPDGSSRRVQQLTGPRNVQLPEDDPQGVGRYQTRIDVNPAVDAALADAAGWRVNLGTFDGTWYAAITADLDAAPAIAASIAALDIGDVLAISNLPVDEALDTVDCLIIGIEEDVPPNRRLVTFYCVPAEPYRVGILANTVGDTDPFLGNLETDGSTTAGSTAAGASTFSVATTSGPLWTTDSDDFPFDVIAGGQRVSVSAIASAIRDTFTRSASSGWGQADSGQQWVVGAGTASLFSATGSVGQIAVSALNTEHHIAVNVGYAPQQRVRTYLTLGVTPTGAAINWGVMLRRVDANNLYWIDVQVDTGGGLTLRVISKIGGANAQLATQVSGTTHSTSVARILVAEIDDGDVIRAKVYADGANEPDWELTYQASHTDLQTGPSVGVIARLITGNTNVGPVNFQFDNFSVLNPQLMTVDTTDRQVVYPIPAGSAVNVQQPIILAL